VDSEERRVADTLMQLADTLVSDYELLDFLDLLVACSSDVLHAAAGGVMLAGDSGQLQLLTSTDAQSRLVELFELQEQEGPCVDCHREGRRVIDQDLARSPRWPQFTPVALRHGFRAVFAFPMRLRGDAIGALVLFRTEPGAVTCSDVEAAQAFADMATIGILQERAVRDARQLAADLQAALDSRVVIEQAKGILAEHAGVDVETAYQVLRWYARSHQRILREVAAAVVSGSLPAADVARSARS
jgi:GAF domain-containing protein